MSLPIGLSALKLTGETLVRATAAAPARLPRLAIGDRVVGQVIAAASGGAYSVSINGETIEVTVTQPVRPGDHLPLRLVARDPRLTFAIANERAPEISGAGRLAAALAVDSAAPREAAAALASEALAKLEPDLPQRLAMLLGQALKQSGLFYEAHQRLWFDGRFALAELRKEPQAALPRPAHALARDASATTPGATGAEATPVAEEPAADTDAEALVHRDALPIVRQQLELLETGQLRWHVQLLPDQWMQWEIGLPDGAPDATESRSWHSRIVLKLPRLGEVTADLRLRGAEVHVALHAVDAGTAEVLGQHGGDLAAALRAAGLQPHSVWVRP